MADRIPQTPMKKGRHPSLLQEKTLPDFGKTELLRTSYSSDGDEHSTEEDTLILGKAFSDYVASEHSPEGIQDGSDNLPSLVPEKMQDYRKEAKLHSFRIARDEDDL